MIERVWIGAAAAVVSQVDSSIDLDVALGEGVVGGAVGAFLTTLVVGAIMIAVVPDYTERMIGVVLDDPVGSFVYGLVSLIALVLLTVLLVITVIGIVVALPLVLLAYVAWAIGGAIAYLAIADRLVGHEDGWLKPLVVGAAINGLLAVTGVGGLISLCIGAAGFGAVLGSRLG